MTNTSEFTPIPPRMTSAEKIAQLSPLINAAQSDDPQIMIGLETAKMLLPKFLEKVTAMDPVAIDAQLVAGIEFLQGLLSDPEPVADVEAAA